MAKRIRKIVLNDDWKARIKAGVLMDRLIKHVNGEIEMLPTQVKAADILLKKIVPDLARQEHVGDPNAPIEHRVTHVTDEEIIKRYTEKK